MGLHATDKMNVHTLATAGGRYLDKDKLTDFKCSMATTWYGGMNTSYNCHNSFREHVCTNSISASGGGGGKGK
jgi:hypothetical protein